MSFLHYYMLILFSTSFLLCIAKEEPGCIGFDYEVLVANREEMSKGNKTYEASYKKLLSKANNLLTKTPLKVVDGDVPPTGNLHDFYTIGKFSWPNPNTPDGMPYIRGDGKYNEEAFGERFDLTRFQQTLNRINTLCLAWFYSGNERYATKAKELLRVWFLDSETAMNPNMNCASALPGVYNGMAVGIIFSVVLIETLDHVRLLQLSTSWDASDDRDLKKWVSDYLNWLQTSKFGKEEKAATNNHGTWYEAQVAAYSLFVGDTMRLKDSYIQAQKHVNVQLAVDGSLPRETKRPSSFEYSVYGLRAFATLARGLALAGYDLWSFQTPDHRSLEQGFDFLAPYMLGEKAWPYKNTGKTADAASSRMWKWASVAYDQPAVKQVYAKLADELKDKGDIRALYLSITAPPYSHRQNSQTPLVSP